MKVKTYRRAMRLFSIAFTAVTAITFVGVAGAQEENLGKQQQGLVGGTVVSAERQEEYGLVTLNNGSCSGSLLRNNWVVTAAHCVDNPDPANKGQFILVPENSVTVTANWKNAQEPQQSMRIITFRPLDVAIIRVATPFSVRGSTTNYNRDIFRDGQFPYFGTPVGVPIMIFGQGINQFAQGSGASATQSQQDGQYRVGFFKTTRQDNDDGQRYWYPSTGGQAMAGGDSGGPSFAAVLNLGQVLVGVHSLCKTSCVSGKKCGAWKGPGPAPADYDDWLWAAGTSECADAPIAPVWDDINRYLGAFTTPPEPSVDSPPSGFIGTFGKTPANYQPMWVYAIKNDGDMLWYRKDTGESPWQGPKKVGNGWNFKDVIPAGGNSIYALTEDGKLLWYRHDGFNDGSRNWPQPVQVGSGWTYSKIFSGGEGIVYAITQDGKLLWHRHGGWADGGGPSTWSGPKVVGSGWGDFKEIFSLGEGKVYAVKPDGTLLFYQQIGWQTGERSWEPARQLVAVGAVAAPMSICDAARAARARNNPAAPGLEAQCRAVGEKPPPPAPPAPPAEGWQNFRQIVPAGNGVILAIKDDGKLLWYRHRPTRQPVPGSGSLGRVREWEGPVEIGSGWLGFKKVIALLPVTLAPIVR